MESIYAKKNTGWLNQYAGMHYGAKYLQKQWSKFIPAENFEFVPRLSKLIIDSVDEACTNKTALDIGCCVAGVTFNLAAKFDEVIGFDVNKGFLEVCEELKKNGKATIYSCEEGDLENEMMAEIPDSIDRSKCHFMFGDAHALPSDIGKFGCVVVSNIIDRLHNPMILLKKLPSLLDDNGICVIAETFCFLETFAPKENWLGGYVNKEGQEVDASNTVKEVLSQDLELIHTSEIPFALQYRARALELAVCEIQIWKKSPKK